MYEEIKKIIMRNLQVSELEILPDTKLGPELNVDSLELLAIITDIEEKYGIIISDDDLLRIETINDLMGLIIHSNAYI